MNLLISRFESKDYINQYSNYQSKCYVMKWFTLTPEIVSTEFVNYMCSNKLYNLKSDWRMF